MVLDPESGVGGYLIGGGADGGVTLSSDSNVTNNWWYYFIGGVLIGAIAVTIPILVGLGLIGGIAGIVLLLGVLATNHLLSETSENNYEAFNAGRLTGITATLIFSVLMFGLVPLQGLFWLGLLYLIATNLFHLGRNLYEWLSACNLTFYHLIRKEELLYA